MAEPSHLQIEDVIYPTLEVRTNNEHSPQGERAGTLLKFGREVKKLDNRPGKYALMISVSSDNEQSRNPPYRFAVDAYAVVSIGGDPIEGEAAEKFILDNGLPIMMGAVRERLAEATARAPWGRFLINAIPLPEALQIGTV